MGEVATAPRFYLSPGDIGLSGPLAVSLLLHLSLVFFTLGGLWQASKNPYGILVERVGVPGGGTPSASAEFEVDYGAPSDVALAPKKKTKKIAPVLNPPTDETRASDGGGRLGNATHGAESGIMGDPNGIQVSVRERYLYELKTFFDQRKTYPESARALSQTGQVEIAFQIRKDGTIGDVKIVTPSTFERLNQAALALVKNAKTFKPLPAELGADPWSLTVPIRYELN